MWARLYNVLKRYTLHSKQRGAFLEPLDNFETLANFRDNVGKMSTIKKALKCMQLSERV